MRELLPLVGRHLREMTRGRPARTALVLFGLGIALAAWLGARSEQAASLMLLSALLVLGLLAAGAALGCGGALPEDRVAGRAEWLATLAPPAWKRRVAAALAGWLLAVALGLVGGLVAGTCVALLRGDVELRRSEALHGSGDVVLTPAGLGHHFDVRPGAAATRTLELDVRPQYRSLLALVDRVEVAWETDSEPARIEGTQTASVRGPVRVVLPEGTRGIRLRLLTPGVTLRVVAARTLGAPVSPVVGLALAGLLLGLLVGALAPVAVLLSRGTTGQTAAAAACCLLLFGAVKATLLALAADLDLEGMAAVAAAVLRGGAVLAPDMPVLEVLTETSALRAPRGLLLRVAPPAVLYGVVALALVALPAPRRFREGTNP